MKGKPLIAGCLFLILIWAAAYPPRISSSGWKTFVFPQVEGWKQSGEVETFSPETLFEYIDGGADIYLRYDFEELKVAEYQGDKKASVTVEIYRHRTSNHAFGIYSQERLASAEFLRIGTQGYRDKDFLNFLEGPYYVKINAFKVEPEDRDALTVFARKVAESLDETGSFPSILSSFPEEGKKKNSETFIAKNFLGYPFLHSSFTAEYELSGKKFKPFAIESTGRDEPRIMVQKYLQQIGKPDPEAKEGCYTISDPHHGEIEFCWKGRTIWGILDLGDASLRKKYLKLFEEGLTQKGKL